MKSKKKRLIGIKVVERGIDLKIVNEKYIRLNKSIKYLSIGKLNEYVLFIRDFGYEKSNAGYDNEE